MISIENHLKFFGNIVEINQLQDDNGATVDFTSDNSNTDSFKIKEKKNR